MKRLATLAASLLLTASASFAAEETVTFKSGTESVSAFLAKPDGPGPFPAVIVLHEWWGLDGWIKDQTRALAREAEEVRPGNELSLTQRGRRRVHRAGRVRFQRRGVLAHFRQMVGQWLALAGDG